MVAAGLTAVFLVPLERAAAQNAPSILFDMDRLRHLPGEFTDAQGHKQPAGTVELVEGKFGQANRFVFAAGASGGFMTAAVEATPDWDRADGFSFWVKGDGSASWGGIELIDRSDFGCRYGYCFPIDSTEWCKIVVPWRDVIPELASPLVDAKTGQPPSSFGNFWFGKWYYWRDYPAESYAIDQIALEPKIELAGAQAAPAKSEPGEFGLARFRAKLRAHKPVTIVTMGDSLTDERHWANKQVVWQKLLAGAIEDKYGSRVTLVNPAIGGTTLSQNAILMPRWSKEAPAPDLVTVWFGGNDWDSGVRGPRFAEYLRLTVDRIRRQTEGSADILLMTTCPAHAHYRALGELEQATRDVAKEKRTALADVAAAFRKGHAAGEALAQPDELLKLEYWAWDKTHLGAKGHEVVKDTVLEVIGADEPAPR